MNGAVMDMNAAMDLHFKCYMDIRKLQEYAPFPIRDASTDQVNVRAIAKCLVELYPIGLISGDNVIIERGLDSGSFSDVDKELILGAITGYMQHVEDLVVKLYNREEFKVASIGNNCVEPNSVDGNEDGSI